MKEKRKILKCVSVILLVLAILFIWSNSLKQGSDSLRDSGFVKRVIESVLSFLGFDVEVAEVLVRKAAHFTEYFILGLLALWVSIEYDIPFGRYASALFCVIIASIDETIQYFVPDRNGNVIDVGIDTLGAISAIAILSVIILLIKRRKEKN